jgi:hypothetical protein
VTQPGRNWDLRTWDLRPIFIGVAALLLVAFAVECILLFRIIDDQDAIGTDLKYFRDVAERWLDTGVYYTDRQLSGPYHVETLVDNLYPPSALFLFVPFVFLPALLWWLVPLGLIAYVVWWCRPVAWALPVLALLIAYPKTPAVILYGNSDIWAVAFSAAGVRWAWPSVLVSFKPSVGFLAFPGIATRRWWIAGLAFAAVNIPLLPLWLHYPAVLLNSDTNLGRALSDMPLFVLPIVAWLTSSRRGTTPIRSWARRLVTG